MAPAYSEKDEGDGPAAYCGRCGTDASVGEHAGCARALELEPPRYCARCRRRMVVQVTPRGWTARCSRHGESASAARSGAVGADGRAVRG